MDKNTLTANFDAIVKAMDIFLKKRDIAGQLINQGVLNGAHKDEMIQAGAAVKSIWHELNATRPKIIEADIKDLIQDYGYCLTYMSNFFDAQTIFAADTGNKAKKETFYRKVKEMKQYIEKYYRKKEKQAAAA